MNKLIVILGPTASGKSGLAIKLAKKFNGEIVSADSRQIYRGMDIGTAKIKVESRELKVKKVGKPNDFTHFTRFTNFTHFTDFMIDIVNPDQEFSLAEYKKRVIKIIRDIQKRDNVPFLVGGTGLYISAIVDNLKIPKAAPNKTLRNKLNKKTNQELIKKLEKLDPEAASLIDPLNKRRLIRALEVCLITGQPFSKQRIKGKPLFNILQIGLKIPKEKLYKKIDQRVDQMIKAGLVDENKRLAKKFSWNLPSMSGIGYKQIGMYLRKKIDLPAAIELIKRDTRRYAKRQMTWFKRDKRIRWIETRKEAEELVGDFLRK